MAEPAATHGTALASFPRSGNTWLRYLIEQATGQHSGSIYQDRILPREKMGVVIKTHALDSDRYTRAIHVPRNPFDAIESYYHWRIDVGGEKDVEWQPHLRDTTARWREHTEHWLNCKCPAHRLRYEDLHANPALELRKVLDWLGLAGVPKERIAAAVEAASLEKMRELSPNLGRVFFRRGEVGAGEAAYSAEQRRYVAGKLQPLLEKFGYCP